MKEKPVKVQCPHCGELVVPVRRSRARWVGGVAGVGLGVKIGESFGIAGGVLGLSGAIVSTWATVPIGLGLGYLLAEKVFTKSRCPKCDGKL